MSTGDLGDGSPTTSALLGPLVEPLLAVVTVYTTAGMVEMLFYGIHFILFWICVFLMFRTKRSKRLFILAPVVVLFLLSTADIACTLRLFSYEIVTIFSNPKSLMVADRLFRAKQSMFVASNFCAELILLYRCYMIWDRSKYALLVCCILMIGDTAWGFVTMGPTREPSTPDTLVPVYLWSVFGFNVLITSITILRMFLASRDRKKTKAKQVQGGGYQTAIVFLVESSAVYSICLLVYLLYSMHHWTKYSILAICFRIVGIMPTLLIVQVGLKSFKEKGNAPTTLSQFQAGTKSIPLETVQHSTMFPDMEGQDNYLRPDVPDEEIGTDLIQEVASDLRNSVTFAGSYMDVSVLNHTVISDSDDTAPSLSR